MIRVMLDSDTPHVLLGMCPLVATYADLATPALVKQFADAGQHVAWIDRALGDPMNLATVADTEPGGLTIGQAEALYAKWESEHRPNRTIYGDRTTMTEVNKTVGNRVPYRWIATLDGTAHIQGYVPGHTPAAIQVLGAAQLGFHADLSLVFEDAWHADAGGRISETELTSLIADVSGTAGAVLAVHDKLVAIRDDLVKVG